MPPPRKLIEEVHGRSLWQVAGVFTAFFQQGQRSQPFGYSRGVQRLFTWRNALAGGVLAGGH